MPKINQQIKEASKAANVYRETVKKASDTRNRLINQANEEYRKARQIARAKYDREVKGR
jgi:F0F1-type ATP synthase membrane subunit b/b'